MGSDSIDERWARSPDGNVILRLIEDWRSGLTEHGDVVLGFTTSPGNDPAAAPGQIARPQFLCTREDARDIAQTILRALTLDEKASPGFAAFTGRIRSPALKALADDWDKARQGRRMPRWDEINPGLTAPYRGCMWGFDHENGAFTGRLAGRHIMQAMGQNFLGTPLAAMHPPHVLGPAQAICARIVSDPACVLFTGNLFRDGEKLVQGERLVLPVGADPACPDGIVGASWYDNYPLARRPEQVNLLFDKADWCQL